MNDAFRRMHRQLGRVIIALLYFAALLLILALGAGVLGLSHSVESFKSAINACGYAITVMATLYALAFAVETVRRPH